MAIFRPKPWVNPFEKMSIFRLFELLERRFSVLEYRKRHFPSFYCLKKKKLEKWRFLDQNHGLTPLRKRPIFRLVELLSFYSVKRRFFVLEYRKRHFPSLYCLKKNGKMAIFGPKPSVNPLGKMLIFRLLKFMFL